MRILLTDIFYRKAFDVINILRRHYPRDSFIFSNSVLLSYTNIKANLIYGTNSVSLLRNDDNFNQDLVVISKKFPDEEIIFVPMEESTTIKFLEFLKITAESGKFKYLLPPLDTFLLSRNKEALNLFCEKNNIPSPAYISKQNFDSRIFKFPIIIKPKHGSGAKDILYIEHENDLNDLKIDFNEFFVQERLPNPREVEAGFFLCLNGETLSYYSHQRIRTYPEKGGVTVFSKCSDSPKIEKLGKSIIQKLNWSGLLMIEFLFDERDNTYKLIEINPRLYGSILLSEFCGADFLSKYVEMSFGNRPMKTVINTQTYIRWIFPYDVLHWLKKMSNPFRFFKTQKDTCYINFTYSNFFRSVLFVMLTYFNFKNFIKILRNG